MMPQMIGAAAGNPDKRKVRTWRRLAAQIGDNTDQSAGPAWYTHGSYECYATPPGVLGKLALPWNGYGTWALYDAADADTTKKVYWQTWDMGTVEDGTYIPWNDLWVPSLEADMGMLVDDNVSGGEFFGGWEFWQLYGTSTRPWVFDFLDPFQNVYQRGWRFGDVLSGMVNRREYNNVGEYYGRGAGLLPKRSMILTGDEVLDAVINNKPCVNHCLAMVGVNMQAGSYAAANDLFSAPGTRVEHPEGQPAGPTIPDSPDSTLFNEGTRFRLNKTEGQVESWLDGRGYTGDLRAAAKVIAMTLVVMGWCAVETGTGQPLIETDPIGPGYPSSSVWQNLGVSSQSVAAQLLDGLITSGTVVVLNPESALV